MASATFEDKSIPGGIVHNPATPFAREMAKWEMGYSPYGRPGRDAAREGFQTYPAMFYKMSRSLTNGDFLVDDYTEAKDEAEARNLLSRGYYQGRDAAIAAIKASEQTTAQAAAERVYRDRNMSENAKAEAQQADDATAQHLAEVPVTPTRKRGRPVKATKADLVMKTE